VTDVERFITHYLAELDARLNHPLQIRGGGGVWEILLKLQEIGVELGLELLNQVPRGTNPGTHMVRQGDEPLKKGHKRRKTTGPK